LGDAALVLKSVESIVKGESDCVVYMIPTHPGHHAARDNFGGYCYLNHAAACADLLQKSEMFRKSASTTKVAVLDIDYHCGNGTASIFYDDPSVLLVSIHCDPNFEYPFHTGHQNQIGVNDGIGTTVHIPLLPGATWQQHYKNALVQGLVRISEFAPDALIVSMGLDTYDQDPCALCRAGFCLKDGDYIHMGETIADMLPHMPTIFIQEGGYRMEVIGNAAKDVVISFCETRNKSRRNETTSTE
jgi:acetoin utilization deacetylase AcuC-like enzyme